MVRSSAASRMIRNSRLLKGARHCEWSFAPRNDTARSRAPKGNFRSLFFFDEHKQKEARIAPDLFYDGSNGSPLTRGSHSNACSFQRLHQLRRLAPSSAFWLFPPLGDLDRSCPSAGRQQATSSLVPALQQIFTLHRGFGAKARPPRGLASLAEDVSAKGRRTPRSY